MIATDAKIRCGWVGPKPHLIRYHDEEWGVPVHDDRTHFEMLLLEGAQAGLTWETILLRREGYRKAFVGFDPAVIARFTPRTKSGVMKNVGYYTQSIEDRSSCNECAGIPGRAEGVWII